MNDEQTPVRTQTRSLEQRMAGRPHVLARFHCIADMMDQALGAGCTVDEAEAQAIDQVRQLGRELLGDWAQEKQAASLERARSEHPQAIKHVKKK